MTQTILLTSIFTYLEGLSGLPDIFYPNISEGTIPDDYLSVHVLPAKPDDIGLTEVKHIGGIIQIDVVTKQGIGSIHSVEIVDLVIASFPRNTVIPTSNIRIDKSSYASNGFTTEEGKWKVPVTITYNQVLA